MATEPMTAAEARKLVVWPYGTSERILAALEEREALLGEREAGKPKGLVAADEYALMIKGQRVIVGVDVLATLRHHEAKAADASVGALVRRIREHKMSAPWGTPTIHVGGVDGDATRKEFWLSDLEKALSHLDSLLPKEPEVVTGESGRQYRRTGGKAIEARHICADGSPTYWATVGGVPVIDAPVVAKLMAKGGKDGEWAMLEQEYQKRFGEDSNAK